MGTKIHIGSLIESKLEEKRMTKQELSERTGIKAVTIRYLTGRESLDVVTLQIIGNGLKYNFFKHYPVVEEVPDDKGGVMSEIEKLKKENEGERNKLQEKITELEKQLDVAKRDLVMQVKENGYLKEINELLKKK